MPEPGIDEHGWISRYEALEDDVRDSPVESLAELDELVADMMVARGFPLEERDGDEDTAPETIRQFAEARRVTQSLDSGETYDPGDVAAAIDGYRELYESLLNVGPSADGAA